MTPIWIERDIYIKKLKIFIPLVLEILILVIPLYLLHLTHTWSGCAEKACEILILRKKILIAFSGKKGRSEEARKNLFPTFM